MRERLSFANVMSVIAVFIALGGSAVAIKANSVGTKQLKRDAVKSSKVKDGSLKGKDLKPNSITSREIEEGGVDITKYFRMASAQDIMCDPETSSFVECGEVTIAISEPSQLLIVGGGMQHGNEVESSSGAAGDCEFLIDGTDTPLDVPISVGHQAGNRSSSQGNGFSMNTTLSPNEALEPGTHTVAIVCNETDADVEFETYLSVLALGGDGIPGD